MRNLLLTIEYDGEDFCGWQVQPGKRTVQGEIEAALLKLTGRRIRISGAGRTDSGVHALGQCANFKSQIDWSEESVVKALNSVLPGDISIIGCREVAGDFHARFSALARSYVYRLHRGRSSLLRGRCWCYDQKLNLAALKRMGASLVGEHDFRSFCVKKSARESNLCTVISSYWTRVGGELTFHVSADRFLHGMVRSLVGTMVKAASGSLSESDFRELLVTPVRSEKVFTAPAQGLCLTRITY